MTDQEVGDGNEAVLREGDLEQLESEDGFVYFRMTGGRFDEETGMPADAAVELTRYSELVYEVARLRWLAEHSDRSAVRGLRSAFDLRLVGVREGSARPILKLVTRYDARQTLGDPTPLFETARDIVNETIASIAVERELPALFPREAVSQLKRLGKKLEDGEAIAFASPRPRGQTAEPAEPAELNPAVRETIATIDAALAAEPEWIDLEGVVTEFDGAKGTFRLEVSGSGAVICHLGAQERTVAETVKAVLAADGVTAPDVSVGGSGTRGRSGTVTSLWDVSEVTIVRSAREKALVAKLQSLEGLDPGWWGPGTRGPGAAAIRNAESLLAQLARTDQHVALGANGDGAVVLEWRRGATACSAEIEADGAMYLFADHTDDDTHEELEAPFDENLVMRFIETGVLHG